MSQTRHVHMAIGRAEVARSLRASPSTPPHLHITQHQHQERHILNTIKTIKTITIQHNSLASTRFSILENLPTSLIHSLQAQAKKKKSSPINHPISHAPMRPVPQNAPSVRPSSLSVTPQPTPHPKAKKSHNECSMPSSPTFLRAPPPENTIHSSLRWKNRDRRNRNRPTAAGKIIKHVVTPGDWTGLDLGRDVVAGRRRCCWMQRVGWFFVVVSPRS